MISSAVQYRLLNGFEDPCITPHLWNELLSKGPSDVIFITWQWQKVWWEVFGRGKLLLIMAEQDGKPFAIAPLFSDDGMVYFVGSGGSDYLDFVGDVSDTNALERMLILAAEHVPHFQGFIFYHIREKSQTHTVLADVAKRQGWNCVDEGGMVAPMLALKEYPEQAQKSTTKRSLLSAENWFNRNGSIKVDHFVRSEDILNHIDEFFEQHIARWGTTEFPSLFLDDSKRSFYKRLGEMATETGWFRLTRLCWEERPVAFHFGFNYRGNFFYYIPSYDVALAKHSPGQVLLRQLILRAQEENAHTFDFGLGDEEYKKRFATNINKVCNRGVHPSLPL